MLVFFLTNIISYPSMTLKLIVGLRNPGQNYALTRHNVGSWFVEKLAATYQASFKTEKRLQADIASIEVCRLILPLTFMNVSGQVVAKCCQFFQIAPEEVLVVHDELDLAAGRVKLKSGGGHGGHNGLRDIMQQIGAHFHRLRFGIGRPSHPNQDVSQFVLAKPSDADKMLIDNAFNRAFDIMDLAIHN